MLRREFFAAAPLVVAEGGSVLEWYNNCAGQYDPDHWDSGKAWDDPTSMISVLKGAIITHFEFAEFREAMDIAYDCAKKGWISIAVWNETPRTIKSLVGVNPKTKLMERLPPLDPKAERVRWTYTMNVP